MKNLLILISIFSFISLSSLAQENYPTKALEKTFNEIQLKDIKKVIAYMDSLVVTHHSELNRSKAYHFFLDSLKVNFLEENNSNSQIAIDEIIKYNFLNSLDSSTFKEIWIDVSPSMVRARDTMIENPPNYHSLDINSQGEVMNYLKRLGKKSEYFKSVHDSIEASGSIGPSLFAGMFYKHHNLDFEKIDDRFWAAIFYLTVEECIEKKINRYYK